jgi:hypothetical protein
MGWPFGRQRGRHVARHAGPAGPVEPPRPAQVPAPVVAAPPSPVSTPAAVPAPRAAAAVQLGFRDGSTYDVGAESPYGRALQAIADALAAAER